MTGRTARTADRLYKRKIKMKTVNWLVVGIVVLAALLLLFGGGMMGGWGYSPFGWIGMFFMWLIPVGIIALAVFGIAWLVRNGGNTTPPSSPSLCPNCGKGVQADWQNCPHCGTALK